MVARPQALTAACKDSGTVGRLPTKIPAASVPLCDEREIVQHMEFGNLPRQCVILEEWAESFVEYARRNEAAAVFALFSARRHCDSCVWSSDQ